MNTSKILILNGPNANMWGIREPEIYGHYTLDDIQGMCLEKAESFGFSIDFRQSNYEGELVTWIQEEMNNIAGLIINACAYTHSSIAIHDALKLLSAPIIEVHMSNPKEREPFRHVSYIEPLAAKTITGKGPQGYIEALEAMKTNCSSI